MAYPKGSKSRDTSTPSPNPKPNPDPIPKAQIIDKYLSLSILESIIRMGAYVEAADGTGRTALMYAAILGDSTTVEMLAQHSELEVTDYEGQTALCFAVVSGKEKATMLLLERGASPDVKDRKGDSLWVAAEIEGFPSLGKAVQARAQAP